MIRHLLGVCSVRIGVVLMWIGFVLADGLPSALDTMARIAHALRNDP